MKTKRLFSKRSWLNSLNSYDTGYVKSYADFEEWEYEDKPSAEISAGFSLSDCTRQVEIDLSCNTKKRAKQRLKKLHLLIDHLYGIHDAIEENMEKLK